MVCFNLERNLVVTISIFFFKGFLNVKATSESIVYYENSFRSVKGDTFPAALVRSADHEQYFITAYLPLKTNHVELWLTYLLNFYSPFKAIVFFRMP
jgi:hypothetical protein